MLYLKGSRGFVILVVHLSIQNWRSLLSKMARSLLCTSIYYLLYIYYPKELGVREARDKGGFPLAVTLPRFLTPYSIHVLRSVKHHFCIDESVTCSSLLMFIVPIMQAFLHLCSSTFYQSSIQTWKTSPRLVAPGVGPLHLPQLMIPKCIF